MLRQLAALTHRVPRAGPRALAVAVYANAEGVELPAKAAGLEGVARVDDAARACGLLCRLWMATGNPALREWAEGLLEFVLWMRAGDGCWFNFIDDWQGIRNRDGVTSAPGVNFWQARAAAALTECAVTLGDAAARAAVDEALPAASAAAVPADVRSLHALAALNLLRAGDDPRLRSLLASWCDEILPRRSGVVLLNFDGESATPHLWGHAQEAVLAGSAKALGREELATAAIQSGDAVFGAAIRSGFDLPSAVPYDVQSAVFVMDFLAAATRGSTYLELGRLPRSWFEGRNPAGAPVYDRAGGRVGDRIDAGRVNRHSGAVANISAGSALLTDPFLLELARNWTGFRPYLSGDLAAAASGDGGGPSAQGGIRHG